MALDTGRKIILLCTGFNLIAEFSVRGINGFFYRLLPVWLFLAYFTFFHMILHVSSVTRGSDKAVLLSAMTLGVPYIFFSTGTAFFTGEIVGFLVITFTIMFFMWGLTQTLLPLAVGGYIFGWNLSGFRLSRRGWIACIGYLIFFLVFSFIESIKGPLYLYVVAIGIILLSAHFTLREINRAKRDSESVDSSERVNVESIQRELPGAIPVWFIITTVAGLISGIVIPVYFEPFGIERLYYPIAFVVLTLWTIVTGAVLFLIRRNTGSLYLPS
jgi:hypothetical protein